jgi:hypothetical protein
MATMTADDWRLQGQESYLQGLTLKFQSWWTQSSTWDHDHCAFCWVHFGQEVFADDPNTQLEGWADEGAKHWICQSCFNDFHDRFDWKIEGDPS